MKQKIYQLLKTICRPVYFIIMLVIEYIINSDFNMDTLKSCLCPSINKT